MNETFMVRTTAIDENESSINKIQTKLTQVQLKTTLNHEQNLSNQTQQQQQQKTPIELVILPKTQDNIIV